MDSQPIEELKHPGFLLQEYLDNKNLTGTKAASLMKMTQSHLSHICTGARSISPDTSLRIAAVFGGEPDKWVNLQVQFELQKAKKKVDSLGLQPFDGGPK